MDLATAMQWWRTGNDRGDGYAAGGEEDGPSEAAAAEGWTVLERDDEGRVLCCKDGGDLVVIADCNGPWAVDVPRLAEGDRHSLVNGADGGSGFDAEAEIEQVHGVDDFTWRLDVHDVAAKVWTWCGDTRGSFEDLQRQVRTAFDCPGAALDWAKD